jgi:protein O-mannosyl-transferase
MLKSAKTSSRIPNWVWGLLLFAATLAVYYPAWNGQPVWDDDAHMTRPDLRSAEGLARIWTQLGATQQYYPLVHSVFWIEHRLFGDATIGYHILNILLHFFSALLIVTILRRLDIPGAWLAAGIFALHPVMVESVAWISELKNTLSGVFFFGAGLAYLNFDVKREKKHFVIAFLLFLFGLLAKSTIATLPAALLVVFWWKRGRIVWKRDAAPLLPFFVIGIISGLFTAWVERRLIGAVGGEFDFTIIDRSLIAGRAVWFYLYKLFWPADLIFTYPRWQIDAATVWQYLFPAALLFAVGLFWRLRNRSRTPLAALLYFMGMLFPSLGFFNIYPFRYSFVADHFQYFASIGPITAVATCIAQGTGLLRERFRRPALWLVCGILISVLYLLSWKQSGMYFNAETLYRTTIQKNPDSWMAHTNIGHLLTDKGQTDEAMAHLEKAVQLAPHSGEAHNNLGVLLARIGRTDEAMAQYKKAVELEPNLVKPHNNLGILLGKTGRTDEAMVHFQKALELNPDFIEAHNNLGVLLKKMGRTDEAMMHFRKVLGLNPNDVEAQNSLGLLLANMGRTDEAMAHYQKALELNPKYPDAHNNLGFLLAKIGRKGDAMAHYLKALELNPDFVEAHNNIGILLAETGHGDEAMVHFLRSIELKPNSADAHYNMCILLANMGRTDEAREHYQKALELNPNIARGPQ